ncbi:MAG: small subunit ribosomal protein [Pyrinomonadaceae bacterium]|jgi:small subunit ribosomal protein S18|nr:small subunit ribosomal protein [Pyrinomonadaceae bacterium]MDQ1589898.1 small subunit ribosomal protein [Pyrinomonadaceae bacterium]
MSRNFDRDRERDFGNDDDRGGGGRFGGGDRGGGGGRGGPGGGRGRFRRRKVCRFCLDKVDIIDFKDVKLLTNYIPERSKVLPRRISGSCAPHQRMLAEAIKRARNIALLPYAADS